MPLPVILDCDPGRDDAVAIALAGRHCDLLGVTTVSGNVSLEKTTRNALISLQVLGIDAPVHAGATRPLVREPHYAEHIHGESGLDGPALPPLEREAASEDAVRFLLETARARDDLWLIATGPLTNVALALRQAPWLARRLRGISIMGGGTFGNVTAAAEFNFWADPEAAAIVFGSGARLVVAGLDVTHQFVIDDAAVDRVRSIGTRASGFVADLLAAYGHAYRRAYRGAFAGPLHDPCAVLTLTHPELFEHRELRVDIETGDGLTRGMSVLDRRGARAAAGPNAAWLERVDAPAALEVLLDALADA